MPSPSCTLHNALRKMANFLIGQRTHFCQRLMEYVIFCSWNFRHIYGVRRPGDGKAMHRLSFSFECRAARLVNNGLCLWVGIRRFFDNCLLLFRNKSRSLFLLSILRQIKNVFIYYLLNILNRPDMRETYSNSINHVGDMFVGCGR